MGHVYNHEIMRTFPGLAFLTLQLLMADAAPAAGWPEEPPRADPDAPTLGLLRAGEVLVENIHLEKAGGAAQVQALFRPPAEVVWDLLGDCASNFRFVEGLEECELLEVSERAALTRQVVKKHWLGPRMEYTFETARRPYEWVAIRRVSGDLEVLEGSWRFDPVDDGQALLVTHRVRVKPKMPVPGWLVRRTLRKDLGDMVACLRALAGASGDEQGRLRDSERCP